MGIEVRELVLDRVGLATADQNAGIDQSDQQLAKCGPNLMTAALHRRWAGTAREVFVNEALDDLIGEISDVDAGRRIQRAKCATP
ncbi:MAG: hypothetical protein IPI03_08310 [Rubrivivax sp.]|nr:hypothetical protein [Rubrivivax sp.]